MRWFRFLLVAALTATLITAASTATGSFAEQLVRAEARTALPEATAELRQAPPAVSAIFLDYAGDTELVLNARLALRRYPDMSAEVLPLYGSQDAFKSVLRRFGPMVVPPIHYFLDNRIASLRLHRAAGETVGRVRAAIGRWWHTKTDSETASSEGSLMPAERGWYAVHFIRRHGHGFLGQFHITNDNAVHWIQTERVVEGLGGFFTSGIRSLETQLRREGRTDAEDYLWAGVDLAAVLGVTKLLRVGRAAARTGRGAAATSRASRAALASRTLARGTRAALRVGKWGVPVAVGYAVIRHPGLISSLAGRAAGWLGTPVWLMQVLVWTLILWPIAWLASNLGAWLVRPVGACFIATGRQLHRRRAATREHGNGARSVTHP